MSSGHLNGFDRQLADGLRKLGTSEALPFIVNMCDLNVVLALHQPCLLGLPVEDHGSQLHEDSTGSLEERVQGGMVGPDVEPAAIDANQVLPLDPAIRTLGRYGKGWIQRCP